MSAKFRHEVRYKHTWNTHDHMLFLIVLLIASATYEIYAPFPVHLDSIFTLVPLAVLLTLVIYAYSILTKKLYKRIKSVKELYKFDYMSGTGFEEYIASLLPKQGFKHIVFTERYDLGIDILAQKNKTVWGIQTKRQSSPAGTHAIRQVVTALKYYDCDQSMVITNSSLTKTAKKLAVSNDCLIIDRSSLLKWINEV